MKIYRKNILLFITFICILSLLLMPKKKQNHSNYPDLEVPGLDYLVSKSDVIALVDINCSDNF